MKLLTNYLFLLSVLSGLVFTSCSDDDNDPVDLKDTYLLSELGVTFSDQVKRPLFKLAYDTNGELATATYYLYNRGEDADNPTKVEPEETTTYKFVHKGSEIAVTCETTDHDMNDEVTEWVTTLTLNNGYIISAKSEDSETVSYTWKDGKLQNVFDYTFTYAGNNVKTAVEESTDTDGDRIYESKCLYTLTCNTAKANSFSIIPFELLAALGDNVDVLVLTLCDNEVEKTVHTDSYAVKNKSDNALIREEKEDATSDYTYSYNENGLMSSAIVKDTYYYKRTDHQNPANNIEETPDTDSYTMHFDYIKKSK
ncbi:MAG: hypothetical protein LBU84_02780 [Prevotella sp.]|jgi:hypothetical protein|nr:hypothetical protein [Prevotella sp.]